MSNQEKQGADGAELEFQRADQLPTRVQRKRIPGWRMPPNTVYVGRPTKWGNPWTPEKYYAAGYNGSLEIALGHCVEAFRYWLQGIKHWAHGELKPIPDLEELRGKNLACWCPLGQPCHADVLLELANLPRAETPVRREKETGV